MKSGADTALLYDNLKHEGSENRFQDILGKGRMYMFITQGIGSILGAFTYTIDPNLPMWISIAFMGVTIGVVLGFEEHAYKDDAGVDPVTYMEQIRDSGQYALRHKKFVQLLFMPWHFYVL